MAPGKPLRINAAKAGFSALLLMFSSIVIAATVYHLNYLRTAEMQRLQDQAATHARVFEGHLTQSLNLVDLSMRNLLDLQEAGATSNWNESLSRTLWRAPYLRSLSLLDRQGEIVGSSEPANIGHSPMLHNLLPDVGMSIEVLQMGLPWSGRDYADGQSATPLRPGRRDGMGFVPLVRMVGSSLRLLAAVNPDYFLNQFAATLTPAEGIVEVRRIDQVLMFTSDDSPTAPLSGTVATLPAENGEEVLALRVSPQYPLSVSVRMNRDLALSAWRSQMRTLLTVVIPAFSLSIGLALVAFRQVQRIERERQQEKLRAHDRLAGRVFEASAEAIIVTDHQSITVRVNPAYTRLSGYSAGEVIGQTPAINRSGYHDTIFYRMMWHALLTHGSWKGEIINRRKDGSFYPAALTLSEVKNADGEIVNYVGLLTDITELRAREDRIRFLSEHDVLTGLPNRALFQDRVVQALALARRSGKRVALLFIDLDRFKPVNDNFGHHVGDLLLQEIARRLSAAVRESDTVARQGGDEFLVILSEIDSAQDAVTVADKLRVAVSAPCRLAGHDLTVTPQYWHQCVSG
jgi:diguanylate cyclase (GGDEF)-like protein/PAS domain S-box-containing protein